MFRDIGAVKPYSRAARHQPRARINQTTVAHRPKLIARATKKVAAPIILMRVENVHVLALFIDGALVKHRWDCPLKLTALTRAPDGIQGQSATNGGNDSLRVWRQQKLTAWMVTEF